MEDKPEFLKKYLALLSSLALALLSVSFPPILTYIGKHEGNISLMVLESSLFSKYAVCLVIQKKLRGLIEHREVDNIKAWSCSRNCVNDPIIFTVYVGLRGYMYNLIT